MILPCPGRTALLLARRPSRVSNMISPSVNKIKARSEDGGGSQRSTVAGFLRDSTSRVFQSTSRLKTIRSPWSVASRLTLSYENLLFSIISSDVRFQLHSNLSSTVTPGTRNYNPGWAKAIRPHLSHPCRDIKVQKALCAEWATANWTLIAHSRCNN
jgi:hypothetical protein